VILIRSLSGSEPTLIWRFHYNISEMVLWCREVGVWCRTGYSSMGSIRLGQNVSLTLNNNNIVNVHNILETFLSAPVLIEHTKSPGYGTIQQHEKAL